MNTMIKLERNDRMTRAIDRAKNIRPHVRAIGDRTFTVTGSEGALYTVHFAVATDHAGNTVRLGICNCRAGEQGMLCYHLAAAAAVNIAIQGMRRKA